MNFSNRLSIFIAFCNAIIFALSISGVTTTKFNNIFIFCDGTANGRISYTNIRRLYEIINISALNSSTILNHVSYMDGIGLKEGEMIPNIGHVLLASDIFSKVKRSYSLICNKYIDDKNVENRVWIFGFSRGAYIARVLAEIIHRCGVLKKELTHSEVFNSLSQQAYKIFLQEDDSNDEASSFYEHYSVRDSNRKGVYFLGLWDTVGAIGIPKYRPGYGFEYSDLLKYQRVPPFVKYVYHAIATHECMTPFEVMHAFPSKMNKAERNAIKQTVEEKWFPGYHLDIGGFCGDQPIPNATLEWMIERINMVPKEERGFELVIPPSRFGRWQWLINRIYFLLGSFYNRVFIRGLLRFHFIRDRFIPGVDSSVLYNGGDWRFARHAIGHCSSRTYKIFRDILVANRATNIPPPDPFHYE